MVGSGNAYNTAQILFSDQRAIICDESNFKHHLQVYRDLIKDKIIDQAVVISASGEKDAIWETELAKKYQLKTTLLTCSPKSSAAEIADQVLVYPKIAEPYTYNISTYLGMILSASQEDPALILNFLENLRLKRGFKFYDSYTILLPDKFAALAPMIDIKKSELFGPKLSLRSFSFGQARHAKFVVRDKKELVISLGSDDNEFFGHPKSRWQIELPMEAKFAFVFCLSYYLVGKIQQVKPPYFKDNIRFYCHDYGPQAYGQDKPFDIVVPGNINN